VVTFSERLDDFKEDVNTFDLCPEILIHRFEINEEGKSLGQLVN